MQTTTPLDAIVREKLTDAQTPGFAASFDPDEAVRAGAFHEDAITADEAIGSAADLPQGY